MYCEINLPVPVPQQIDTGGVLKLVMDPTCLCNKIEGSDALQISIFFVWMFLFHGTHSVQLADNQSSFSTISKSSKADGITVG